MPFLIRPCRHLSLAYVSGFFLLIAVLLLSNGPAHAEWVVVAEAGKKREDKMTVYVDPETIRRKGDLVNVWVLFDYDLVQRSGEGASSFMYLSNRHQEQFDCVEERSRWLAAAYISGNMGEGEVVFSKDGESNWKAVHPQSVGQAVWKRACGMK
jgi:hypothetical protein